MSSKMRFGGLWLDDELYEKIRGYSEEHACKYAETVRRALRRFFKDTNEDTVVRSLAVQNRRIKACMDNLSVCTEMVFMLMRTFLMTFPPPQEEDKDEEGAIKRLDDILYDIAKNILSDERVTGYVYEKMAALGRTHIAWSQIEQAEPQKKEDSGEAHEDD